MPCWEVRTMSVDFKADNQDLLTAAMQSLGWTAIELRPGVWQVDRLGGQIDLAAGRATIAEGRQSELNQLKRAYSRKAVEQVAKKNRWRLSAKNETEGVFLRS